MVIANPGWAELWVVEGGGARRPALVLTRPKAVDRLERVLVVLATTNIRGLTSEVRVGPREGLQVDSVLNTSSPLRTSSLPPAGSKPSFDPAFVVGRAAPHRCAVGKRHKCRPMKSVSITSDIS